MTDITPHPPGFEAARLTGGWVPCANFARGAKALELMANFEIAAD